MPHRFPILVVGWKRALVDIKAGTHELRKYSDGHAELITLPRWPRDNYAGQADGFLRVRSAELLEAALAKEQSHEH